MHNKNEEVVNKAKKSDRRDVRTLNAFRQDFQEEGVMINKRCSNIFVNDKGQPMMRV